MVGLTARLLHPLTPIVMQNTAAEPVKDYRAEHSTCRIGAPVEHGAAAPRHIALVYFIDNAVA